MNVTNTAIGDLFQAVAARSRAFRESVGERPHRPAASYAEMCAVFDEPTPEEGRDGLRLL